MNHPNIVTVYDIGQASTGSFIAMELIEGRTLRELVVEGPMPSRRLLGTAVQIADGLAKAHEAGIVHRDLKPENVMVTRDGGQPCTSCIIRLGGLRSERRACGRSRPS